MLFMIHHKALFVVAVIAVFAPLTPVESFVGTVIYSDSECSGTPLVVSVVGSIECEAVECGLFIADGVTYSSATTCENTDRQTYVADALASSSYVLIETFTDNCKDFMDSMAFVATGKCHIYDNQGDKYVVTTVNEDGSATLGVYNDSSCTGAPILGYEADRDMISTHSCYKNHSVIYTSDRGNLTGSDTSDSVSVRTRSQTSSTGSSSVLGGSSSDQDSVSISDEAGSEAGMNATVSIESSTGINTGAIVGILVAYIMLCIAACVLCMDRIERVARRLGMRR